MIKATAGELEKTGEIGPEIAKSIRHFFTEKENVGVLDGLIEAGVSVQPMPQRKKSHLKGKTFVFSGSLEKYTRDEAERAVESLGGMATSSISGNTDYLVVGENPGSKLAEAKKEKVKIIGEKEFKELLGRA